MYRETRQLAHQTCVFSEHDTSLQAKEWRFELLYRLLLLLRTSMAVIDYPTTGIPAWDLPELSGMEKDDIVNKATFMTLEMQRWAHHDKPRSEWEESMRVPIRLAFLLRKTIHSQETSLNPKIPTPIENKLHASVDGFMAGYYAICTFLTTPVPFPLIQMARTFLFLYVYTIPFVLLGDPSSVYAHYFYVFLITYGYMVRTNSRSLASCKVQTE
jgi:Bestrophin, RFP-TM, chloride channel